MILCIRKIKRTYAEASTRQKVAVLGITVILFWVLGLFDRLTEKSFDEFSWPKEAYQKVPSTKFTYFPKCKFAGNDPKLLIVVKSSARNGQMRESVRKTWGKYQKADGIEVMPVFVVGHSENSEVRRQVDKEKEEFKDVLEISSIDSYRNNTFKLFAALDYASSPRACTSPDFVLLVDDDYIVHVPNLLKFAKTQRRSDPVYEGFVFHTSPFRLKIHKHSISVDEYPFSRYPPYVSAGAVFLTSETVRRFQKTMRSLKMFPFDDVFTGILAKTLSVPATHNENFVFWSRHITRNEWDEGVIAVHGFARKDLEYEYNLIFG
ncbi:unnamed protein product [Caenorhabditis sp. 36 PRJEB53466]|nr:unnamed protein product [Caenorhabditis sp. 36 PRJEB53466]